MIPITAAPPWAEAVFHVLAHVDAGALAASCYEPVYIAWASRALGDASARSLAEDARILRAAARTHETLARVQALAWVFRDEDSVARASERDLSELADRDVADPRALAASRAAGPPAEILRAAAELELPLLHALPEVPLDREAIASAIERVLPAAPSLAACTIQLLRPLGLRGRIFGESIFVGVPGLACPDEEHVAWQAAHEATVRAVQREIPSASFITIERQAVARLRDRARDAALTESHARWLSRFDLSGLGAETP